MSRINFGNTWWGQKWLDALTQIDYENRLPRGKSYARNNAVFNIKINNNEIKASVRGSRPKPYQVKINIPAFSLKSKKAILKIIIKNKFLLSQLMIRQLPSELYKQLQEKKINLFPKNWNDLQAECSCPDWALPCKHIAAVIYLIANEIDKNPFLVFRLHNFNIFKELKKYNYDKNKIINSKILCLRDIFEKKLKHKNVKLDINKVKDLDFSSVPNLTEQIFSLFDNNPAFYPQGNFKLLLEKLYKTLPKALYRLSEAFDQEKKLQCNREEYVKSKIVLNQNLEIKNHDNLIAFLESMPFAKITHHSDQAIALNLIYRFAWRLAEQGAFIPQLIKLKSNQYCIIWVPCLINKKIESIFQQLLEIMPHDMLSISLKTKNKNFSLENQLKLLIFLFLKYFINLASTSFNFPEHNIINLFFSSKILKADNLELKEVPQLINLWLSKFFIKHKTVVPVLKVQALQNKFQLDVLIDDTAKHFVKPKPLKQIFSDKKFNRQRIDIMRDLALLSAQFPEIKSIIQSEGRNCLEFDSHKFADVLFKALPLIKLLGIQILMPKALQKIISPKVSLALKKRDKTKNIKSYLSLNQMLDFDWQIALGDQFISQDELIQLQKESGGIVKFKDKYSYINHHEMQNLLKKINQAPKFSKSNLLKIILAQEYQGAPLNISSEASNLIKSLLKVKKISLPGKLKAELRHYQKNGYWWLYKNSQIGFGSLIADDMGLGKTLQVIALCLKLKEQGLFAKHPGLIIVPTTLLTNWQKEIEKFAPNLQAHIYHGSDRNFGQAKNDLLITTYGLIRRDQKKFNKKQWPLIAIDEAQNIKNINTAQTKAIKSIKSPIRIAMTGTPVENRLSEYFSIIDFLNRGYLGSANKFAQEYSKPIELYRDKPALQRFKKITAPFILRRLKTDKSIIKDLPKKNEINQFCNLTKEQAVLYKSVVDNIMNKIQNSNGIERKGLVFKLMTSLKQICNHPAHFLKKKTANPQISGKTALLLDILQTIYENNEKVLLFTQYTEMGKLLVKILEEKFGSEILFLHGGVARKKRDELIDRFQGERQLNVMILSLKAGGTGLNLTSASNVIHFDLWWNPAVEQQATDRAYRIGQTKNVMVHRLIIKNTFEEKINKMIQDKKKLADLTVATGEKWIGELSNKELKDLFKI